MKRSFIFIAIACISILLYPKEDFGQDSLITNDCEIKDVNDLLGAFFSHKKEDPQTEEKEKGEKKKEKKINFLILPTISVNPTNGFLYGATGTGTWFFGDKKNTQMSVANARIVYTTKNQLITYIKSNIYTKNDDYYLEGDLRYYIYKLPTYGLGTNAPDTTFNPSFDFNGLEHEGGGGSYPMDYNFFIFHQTVNKKIVKNLYAGIGYHIDSYWDIRDELLNLDTIPLQITPHWAYSKKFGFDSSAYISSGISVNFIFDSRDNPMNAYKGYYFRLDYRMNATFLGSSKNSTELFFEFKTYVGLSKKIPRHLLAFWLWGNFQMSGHMPYYTLMSLGDDQKATSGRGYIAGRFRGAQILYGEVEYRFPLLRCAQTLGGVIFINATTANNDFTGVSLFDYVRPAAGIGLRILMNKNVRLNLTIDYAIGWKSQGIYFGSPDVF